MNNLRVLLIHAVINRKLDLIKECIDMDFDLNSQDVNGNTIMHLAVYLGNCDVVALLKSHNANISIKNNQGITPGALAIFCKHDSIIKYFYL